MEEESCVLCAGCLLQKESENGENICLEKGLGFNSVTRSS